MAPNFCAPPADATVIERNGKSCTHRVASPEGDATTSAAPPEVQVHAHKFEFDLDPFQHTAINALEAGDSVLVAAHTSAGKTAVAQYAIAMALRDKTRVIYTSPLKALSNQKYKEFAEEFGDVGLMTGDITINPDASCLVLTTEILRSMLYHCSEVVAEAGLIVFDEIHYIKDKERGVVWEETIILLPDACQYAFLSATIPNAMEFAQWVASIHKKRCHVVYTDYRPVPLQHFIMPCDSDRAPLFCVVRPHERWAYSLLWQCSFGATCGGKEDEIRFLSSALMVDKSGKFQESSFQKAVAAMGDFAGSSKKGKKKTDSGVDSDMYLLAKLLVERTLTPVIVFALSKRACTDLADKLAQMQVNDEQEAKLVDAIFWSAMDVLPEQDRNLPQVAQALPMLRRGIGVHHSGLLPIVKEAIEVLFSEGLIKVLFATETFSTGLNMPARTVVFHGVRKFDGVEYRNLTGGEYIQMSGRAGRRGLDDAGTVVLMCDSKLEPSAARSIVKGTPDPLHSAFRLTYASLLCMLRLDQAADTAPERLIGSSLKQFQARAQLPALQQRLAAVDEAAKGVSGTVDDAAGELYHLLCDKARIEQELRDVENRPKHAVPFLQPGRLVRVARLRESANGTALASSRDDSLPVPPDDRDVLSGDVDAVWGAVISFERLRATASGAGKAQASDKVSADPDGGPGIVKDVAEALDASYIVDVLAHVRPTDSSVPFHQRRELLCHDDAASEALVVTVPLTQLAGLGTARIKLPKVLKAQEHREDGMRTVAESIKRLQAKNGGCVPMLDPTRDLKVSGSQYRKLQGKLRKCVDMLHANHLFDNLDERIPQLKAFMHQEALMKARAVVAAEIKAAEGLILQKELKQRMRVLRRLGYMDESDIVTQKGHVAAVLSSGNCLVLTELLMHGALSSLTAVQITSVLSCSVWSEASDRGGLKIRDELQGAFGALRESARRVGLAQADAGMACDIEGFINSFRPDLIDIVTMWASKSSFAEVKKAAKSIYEGSIVRAIRRLHELLVQMKTACEIIGDSDLANRMEAGAASIHRDVVFAASLYL